MADANRIDYAAQISARSRKATKYRDPNDARNFVDSISRAAGGFMLGYLATDLFIRAKQRRRR